jgi:hypothetical protein
MSVIPTLRKLKQEDCEVKLTLDSIASSRPTLGYIGRPCLKKKVKIKGTVYFKFIERPPLCFLLHDPTYMRYLKW